MAEIAEVFRSERHSTRRVQFAIRDQSREQISVEIKHVDESVAGPGDTFLALPVLHRVGDTELAPDPLNVEGGKPRRQGRICKSAVRYYGSEGCVEHVDCTGSEVWGIQHGARIRIGDR